MSDAKQDETHMTDWLNEAVRLMARLRAKDGCPWDHQQTHVSLKRYLVEETAELLDAIDGGDDQALKDELGDVFLQVIFHAQIAAEDARFDAQGVAKGLCEKLIRRHPHVFGDQQIDHAEGVVTQWEQIKQQERKEKKSPEGAASILQGVPKHLPALHRAYKVQKKAAQVGFDWPRVEGVFDKIQEEVAEVREAMALHDKAAVAEELGDLLFAVTNLSRFLGHFPEETLHKAVRKFENRFLKVEQRLQEQGKTPDMCDLEELDALWERAKREI
jgi:tetrapyrrole methylase family protein / MazG family protein